MVYGPPFLLLPRPTSGKGGLPAEHEADKIDGHKIMIFYVMPSSNRESTDIFQKMTFCKRQPWG